MKRFLKISLLGFAVIALGAVGGLIGPAVAQNVACRLLQGGAEFSATSGCTIDVETGATLNVESGGTFQSDSGATFSVAGTTVTATGAEMNYLDLATLGTQAASKVVSADSSNDVTGFRVAAASAMNIGGNIFVKEADFNVTSAELLALNATPITAVAAPGAGTSLVPIRMCCQVDYVAAAYAGIAAGEDVALRYTNGSGDIIMTLEATGWLDATADTITCDNVDTDFIPVDNAALVVHMTTGEVITGDSPLDCRIWYSDIPTELP